MRLVQSGDVAVIKPHRALDVGGRGGRAQRPSVLRTEITVQFAAHSRILRYHHRMHGRSVHLHRHPGMHHLVRGFVIELVDVPAGFTRLAVVAFGGIDHDHPFGPLDQSVEVVGVDPFVVARGGKAVSEPQVVRDKRGGRGEISRKGIVVHREDEDVFEVERPGFQDSHDLHPLQRLPLVGYPDFLQDFPYQRQENIVRRFDPAAGEVVPDFTDLLPRQRQVFPLSGVLFR